VYGHVTPPEGRENGVRLGAQPPMEERKGCEAYYVSCSNGEEGEPSCSTTSSCVAISPSTGYGLLGQGHSAGYSVNQLPKVSPEGFTLCSRRTLTRFTYHRFSPPSNESKVFLRQRTKNNKDSNEVQEPTVDKGTDTSNKHFYTICDVPITAFCLPLSWQSRPTVERRRIMKRIGKNVKCLLLGLTWYSRRLRTPKC